MLTVGLIGALLFAVRHRLHRSVGGEARQDERPAPPTRTTGSGRTLEPRHRGLGLPRLEGELAGHSPDGSSEAILLLVPVLLTSQPG